MDGDDLKKTMWELCNLLVGKSEFIRSRDYGMNMTHQVEFADIGVSMTRWAEIGAINNERIVVSHRDWQAVSERTWPDWDAEDRAARMRGLVKIDLTGDPNGPMAALMWLRLRG